MLDQSQGFETQGLSFTKSATIDEYVVISPLKREDANIIYKTDKKNYVNIVSINLRTTDELLIQKAMSSGFFSPKYTGTSNNHTA